MASLYQRGKKRIWWIKYYVNGRPFYRSLHTTNARVAERVKRQIEGEQATGELLAPSKTPLPALLEDFCRFMSTFRPRKSCSADVSVLRVFFGPICPSLELGSNVNRRFRGDSPKRLKDTFVHRHVPANLLEDVTGAIIEDFITCRIREDRIAPKTANRTREVLHKLFNYAIRKWNFVARDRRYPNPAAMVPRQPEPQRVIRFLTAEQIKWQLEVLEDHAPIRDMVATYIYAGLRREEALWLTDQDVDLDRRLMHVRAKKVAGASWQPKTRQNRVVPISGALAEILNNRRRRAGSSWFFPSPQGRRWDPDNFSQDLRKINVKHGLPWSCLDYRHTFGSHLAQKGVSLHKIAKLMGNSPEICRRHYAALVPEQMHDEVEFSDPDGPDPRDDLLRQVLSKLERWPPEDRKPHLRLVR